ncbi:hypothetical protein [Paenibacillus paeoniae]|uniref:Uncharacterized protein n=1 Tax=Paenibacillus paeoniae TaxID=2292705 RepID=A0A371P5U5_9BACL|nr:hypothetical protein [Paenibacillus paeoniae]REK71269.1 hypothetical protein DX130_22780 [Paenibacillus paeoniae]
MTIDKELVERISSITWFSNCGNPLGDRIQLEVVYESNWKKAAKRAQSNHWEAVTLEAGNELTEFLSLNYPDLYKQWNHLVREGKEVIELHIVPKINEYIKVRELSPALLDHVKWDMVSAIMEHNYMAQKEPGFFIELLKVYESGNFPCGWKGKWPKGKLIIY